MGPTVGTITRGGLSICQVLLSPTRMVADGIGEIMGMVRQGPRQGQTIPAQMQLQRLRCTT
jgi:hypothetical protein